MPTPSVSCDVHYVAYGTPGGEFPAGRCRAAVIAEIPGGQLDEHETVDLVVFNPKGIFFDRCPHDETITGSDRPDGGRTLHHRPGTWHWPERVD